ncbi:hypothetical protein N0V90_002752 [Kalmusia sp. IMI 367209]|nr:hypothetical protein N0V90_002752 [Kalmusia sp. IMI 367209]
MSFARGERVYFDLDNGNIESAEQQNDEAPPPALASAFVGDILERPTGRVAPPPVAPSFKANANGFPAHKKRTPRVSAFRRERAAKGNTPTKANAETRARTEGEPEQTKGAGVVGEDEKRQIDEENKQRLAKMSSEEIEQEQRELLESLPPSLIQRLLGRANIDDGSNERDWDKEGEASAEEREAPKTKMMGDSTKKVSFMEPNPTKLSTVSPPTQLQPANFTKTATEPNLAADLAEEHGTIHFPRPTQPPDLDPNDPSFLKNLHEKYFPNLAYDPSTLSWMTPIDPDDSRSPYHPSHRAFDAKDIRFDFKGALLAPSTARDIPIDQGLHHHADAPEAAGYTIAELAVMARSSVAAQRCIAFQTLGRILYRLGRGEFGFEKVRRKTDGPVQVVSDPNQEEEVDEDEIEVDMVDAGSAMASGLWNEVEEGKVVKTLTEEANRERGHLTARTYAQEALWNWRRGGGRKRAAI